MTDDVMNEGGLIAKRDELLAEVRKLKARLAEVEGERDAEKVRADAAESNLQRVTVDEPVEAVLSKVFAVSLHRVMPDLKEHYRFDRGEDGQLQFRTKEGEPVMVKDREAGFAEADIHEALSATGKFDDVLRGSLASGSGSPGGSRHPVAKADPKKASIDSPFGLR